MFREGDRCLRVIPSGYKYVQDLPTGTLGRTLLLKQRVTDKLHVMKLCEKTVFGTDEAIADFKSGLERLNLITNEHLLGVISFWETEEFIVVVRRYLEAVPLIQYITSHKSLPTASMVTMWKNLCEQVLHLHQNNVGPVLIRANNVFVNFDGSSTLVDMYPIPVDLGDRVCIRSGGDYAMLPPELLRGEPLTLKSDSWGMASLLVLMVSGELPGPQNNLQRLFHQIQERQLQFSSRTPRDIREIVEKVLVESQEDRPDLETLLKSVNKVRRFSVSLEIAPSTVKKAARNILRRTTPVPLKKGFGGVRMLSITRTIGSASRDFDQFFNTT